MDHSQLAATLLPLCSSCISDLSLFISLHSLLKPHSHNMALKSFIHLLASFLLVSTMVSSKHEELLESGIIIKVPPQSPLKSPISPAPVNLPPPVAAPVKVPPPVAPIPVKVPPPQAPVPVKAPPPQAPAPVKVSPPPQTPVPVKVSPPPQAPVPVKVAPPPPFVKPPVKAPPVSSPPPYAPPPPPRNTKECYPPCLVRCKLHSRKNVCLRACVTCCDRCKCVPPGQFGNKEICGKCYVNMTTHGGKSKCP